MRADERRYDGARSVLQLVAQSLGVDAVEGDAAGAEGDVVALVVVAHEDVVDVQLVGRAVEVERHQAGGVGVVAGGGVEGAVDEDGGDVDGDVGVEDAAGGGQC